MVSFKYNYQQQYVGLSLHVVHKNVVGCSCMIGFPHVIAVSEWGMPGILPGPLGWHTNALTNEQQEVVDEI